MPRSRASQTRGAACWFANEYGEPPIEFAQLGINVTVLEPGQSSIYHAEANQEAFLVLEGECRLLVEGEERRLRRWDFFNAPPWTEHAFVGAGEGPCAILMAGARSGPGVRYPLSELALRYGAGVQTKVFSATGNVAIPVGSNSELRIEGRYDKSDGASLYAGSDSQFTGTIAGLAWF